MRNPKRSWKRNWKTYLGHMALGALTGLFILTDWPLSGFAILASYMTYQTVEVIRRVLAPAICAYLDRRGPAGRDAPPPFNWELADSPAIDVADFMGPMIAVLLGGWVWEVKPWEWTVWPL